jgi:hypothetical protein
MGKNTSIEEAQAVVKAHNANLLNNQPEKQDEKNILISALPLEKLIAKSKALTSEGQWLQLHAIMKNSSPTLNPNGHPGHFVFGLSDLKGALAESQDHLASAEYSLRQLWQSQEYFCKINGEHPVETLLRRPPSGQDSEAIWHKALRVLIFQSEIAKLSKAIDAATREEKAVERARRLYKGSCKRSRQGANGIWEVSEVDGMTVDEKGMITELNQHIDSYLAICAEHRSRRSRKSKAA